MPLKLVSSCFNAQTGQRGEELVHTQINITMHNANARTNKF